MTRLDPWPTTAQALRQISWLARNDTQQLDVFCDLWEKAYAAGDIGPDHPSPFNSPGALWESWKHQPARSAELHSAADRLAAKHGFITTDRGAGKRPRYWFERKQH
jgi:hypothetical protein